MIQLTRPVLIAAVAGVVAIASIAVAAWRLSSVGGAPTPEVAVQGQAPSGAGVSQAPNGAGVGQAPNGAGVGQASGARGGVDATTPAGAGAASGVTPRRAEGAGSVGTGSPAAPPQQQAAAGSSSSSSSPVATTAPAPVPAPAAASGAQPGSPGAVAAAKPSFDVVRIDPAGDAVVAGRAEPRARVALTLSGRTVAETQADADGQFVILPPTLPPGDHVLGLSARGQGGEIVSEQTVAIAVPQRGGQAVAALAAPDKPTVVLSQPAGPAGGAASDLRIGTVEAQQGGAFLASGVAPPGSTLRVYLNEAFVASVDSGTDGKWSVRVERGMTPGAYRVRADRVAPDGRTVARVEAPFDYPVTVAGTPVAAVKPGASGSSAPGAASGNAARNGSIVAADPQNAVVDQLRTARVERGDSLWRISRTIYGEGMRYTQIYDANASQIRNPDLIYPGQVLVVPKQDKPAAPAPAERRR